MMKRLGIKGVLFLLSAGIVCMCLSGCYDGIFFTRSEFTANGGNYGNIVIGKVSDSREADYGKGEANRVGNVRGSIGIPDPIYLQQGKTITGEVETTVNQALTQSGYTVAEEGSPTLEVSITRFWCDGWVGYKVEGTIELRLLASDKTTVVYKKEIDEGSGFSNWNLIDNMFEAFNTVMNTIGKDIANTVKSDEFQAAYKKARRI